MSHKSQESKECALIRETLNALEIALQRNTDQLNQLLETAPIASLDDLLSTKEETVCIPDKLSSERWYRNILKQLKGGRNVEAVFRQLMIVCQSYGFSLPPPSVKETTLKPTVSLFTQSLEVQEVIWQIYSRLGAHYCGLLKTLTNQYQVTECLTSLSYVMDPYIIFRNFRAIKTNALNSQIPQVTSNSDLLVFYTRITAVLSACKDMIINDIPILITGVLREVAEPHILIRLLYLDRISKELEISLEQLHQTNQLKMYFCEIAKMCFELEQQTEYLITQYCGLSILDKVTTVDKENGTESMPEVLWNWRVEAFAPYSESFIEKVRIEKLELLSYLGEIPGDFWRVTTCSGSCLCQCSQYRQALSIGCHSILCRLVKYSDVIKHLGSVADYIAPQELEDNDSSTNTESLSDAVNSFINEIVAALLITAEELITKVPDICPLEDLLVCSSSLHILDTSRGLPLTATSRTVLLHTLEQITEHIVTVAVDTICNYILQDETTQHWRRTHTIEVKTCSPGIVSLNLYLRWLFNQTQNKLPQNFQKEVMLQVLEKTLTYLTRIYLTVQPSKSNTKLYLYDITGIVMIYSTFVWVFGDTTEITEPQDGHLMVIFSHLNRLLSVMSVISCPLSMVLKSVKEFSKKATKSPLRKVSEIETGSDSQQSPVLPHNHSPGDKEIPVTWLPSVWITALHSIENLDLSLLYLVRIYNLRHPPKQDILLSAISDSCRLPQQIQLFHNRDVSQFEYSEVVLTMSRILSCCKFDITAWPNFILTTFIPNEIWNSISKPDFKFGRRGSRTHELWQECIGEVLQPALLPMISEAVQQVVYRTYILPSTEEDVAIEELPCSCRINRYSTPNIKTVLHDSLRSIFTNLSLLVSLIPPQVFKLAKLLCIKAKLKQNSETSVIKLIIAFFIKRVFMNPNGVLNSKHAYVPPTHERVTPKSLPFVEIPEDALSILRKIGDTVRLIVMNDVQNVISLSTGAQNFVEEQKDHINGALLSFQTQIEIGLTMNSEKNEVQLQLDIQDAERTYPGIFNCYLAMIFEITDVISKDSSGFYKTLYLLPTNNFNPITEFRHFGCYHIDDISKKIWDFNHLSEYLTSDLLGRYINSRWEFKDDAQVTDDVKALVVQIKSLLQNLE